MVPPASQIQQPRFQRSERSRSGGLWRILFLALLTLGFALPDRGVRAAPTTSGGFARVAPEASGLTFSNQVPLFRQLTNQMLLDGSGVAAGDVDQDGRPDLFFGATGGRSSLWRNLGGWRFEDVTSRWFPSENLSLSGDVTGVAFADLNGDALPDLVLNTHADGVRVLLQTKTGVFEPMSFPQSSARGGHSLAIADVDGDGWLDLYVCNYRRRALMDMPNARATFRREGDRTVVATIDGRPTSEPDLTNRFVVTATGAIEELGEPDVLYRNLGGTNFAEVPWNRGAFLDEDGKALSSAPPDWGLAAQFRDVNGDGRPDLYVCNDFQSPDRFWINDSTPGHPRFRLAPRTTLRHTSQFSMGVDFADLDANGRPDFVVVDMLSPDHLRRLTMLDGTGSVAVDASDPLARPQFDANTLFLQRSDGSFLEAAAMAGVMATDWSWTPVFLDVDLDGWPDLLVSAGQERGSRDLDVAEQLKQFRRGGIRSDIQIFRERQKFPRLAAPIRAFRHRGDPVGGVPRFDESTQAWGLAEPGVHHGMALADLDGDGDLDLAVNAMNSPAGLYRNEAMGARLRVTLRGRGSNSAAVGAQLRFRWKRRDGVSVPPQSTEIVAGGRYLSGDAPERVFACPGDGVGELVVRWPGGRTERWEPLSAGTTRILAEGEGLPSTNSLPAAAAPRLALSRNASEIVVPPAADPEFAVQPTLPRRLGTRLPVLASTGSGILVGADDSNPIRATDANGRPAGTAASSGGRTVGWVRLGDEWIGLSAGSNRLFRIEAKTLRWSPLDVPVPLPESPACLAGSDSGRWIFVGAGSRAGRFPEASGSALFRLQGEGPPVRRLPDLGMVSAAAFVDFEAGGEPELLVVSDWGTPHLLRIGPDSASEWELPVRFAKGSSVNLSSLSGWWQAAAVADVDGDRRPDLLLGNWGFNSAFAVNSGMPDASGAVRPLYLYPGGTDAPDACVEAYTDVDGTVRPLRSFAELGPRMPSLQDRFTTHRAFAMAGLPSIVGAGGRVPKVASHLGSLLLLNRGDHLEATLLPDAVQAGPVFGFAVGDLDGDGLTDVFCAQGFHGHNFGQSRDDSGEGVILFGLGGGRFEAVTLPECGVRVPGEQRSALITDLDGDGRNELVVGVHGGPVEILRRR